MIIRLRSGAMLAGITLAATAIAVLASWWATNSTAAAQDGAIGVDIVDFGFDEPEVTVPVGRTVRWTNTGARPHTATDRGGTFDTQPINPGEQGSITFTAPGTYFYFCRINPLKMNAVVKVEPGPEPSKAVRVQTVDPGNIEGEQLRFDPPQLAVPAGTTLLVANVGGKPHSLTAEDGSFSTGIIQPGPEAGRFAGSNATLTLSQPGTFKFFCEIHPAAMKGTVTVSGSAAADAGPAPPSNGARTANVSIADFEFKEPQISVAPEAEITFRNIGEAPHTATFDDVELDTGKLDTGAEAKLTAPAKPGSYSYFCAIHTRMRGVVVVLGQNTADPTAAPSTTAADADAIAVDKGGADGGGTASPAVTVAPNPPTAYTAAGTISGAMKGWVLATVAIAFFLGGVGITPFLWRRARPAPDV